MRVAHQASRDRQKLTQRSAFILEEQDGGVANA
jgi:hypothetical protein